MMEPADRGRGSWRTPGSRKDRKNYYLWFGLKTYTFTILKLPSLDCTGPASRFIGSGSHLFLVVHSIIFLFSMVASRYLRCCCRPLIMGLVSAWPSPRASCFASSCAGVGFKKVELGALELSGRGASGLPRPLDGHELRVVLVQKGTKPVAGVHGEGVAHPVNSYDFNPVWLCFRRSAPIFTATVLL